MHIVASRGKNEQRSFGVTVETPGPPFRSPIWNSNRTLRIGKWKGYPARGIPIRRLPVRKSPDH